MVEPVALREVPVFAGTHDGKTMIIEFHPADPPDSAVLYTDASASEMESVLEATLARIRSGRLRMPVAGGLRWVVVAEEQ